VKLFHLGVDYDVIAPTMSFDQYEVILLPRCRYIPESVAQALLDFVESGGTLVILNQPGDGGALLQPGAHGQGNIVQLNPDDEEAIADYMGERAGVLQSDSTPPLSAVTYTDGQGNYVVHLFTTHTDLSQNFPVLENVQVTLPVSIEGLKISYASLENPDLVPLEATNIVLPSIKTYGLLVIEKP